MELLEKKIKEGEARVYYEEEKEKEKKRGERWRCRRA